MIPPRDWIIPLLAVIVLLTVCARARAEDLPPGITCDLIRSYVAQHGKPAALAWAVRQGYSLHQIREARKCLR